MSLENWQLAAVPGRRGDTGEVRNSGSSAAAAVSTARFLAPFQEALAAKQAAEREAAERAAAEQEAAVRTVLEPAENPQQAVVAAEIASRVLRLSAEG